jgi:hypothetical protein
MAENKKQMTADERQEALFQRWLSPKDPQGNDLAFQSPEAEKAYKESATRIKDAIQMKKSPDRVPVCLLPSFFPVYYSGMNPQEVMYDYDKCYAAFKKFTLDFAPDGHIGSTAPGPAKVYEILDYKQYAWPGHGVAPQHSFQCLEGEYMKADEYDALIDDPSNFFSNIWLPRVFGALEPWTMLPFFPGMLEIYGIAFNFIPFGLPPLQGAFKALFEAGAEALKWAGTVMGLEAELTAMGFPQMLAGYTKAPFDVLGDTLRGTKGIMTDMYRRPDKVIKAMEALTPLMIKLGVGGAQMNGKPIIFMPLHKGIDGFLSDEQYKKFYWPTLREVMMGLIEAGCVPFPATEGSYNTRLKIIKNMPRGKTVWMFDRTDMVKAKEIIGDTLCILGNVSSTMLNLGTPQEVRDYCKKLIDTAGKGGGFIMANGSFFDEAKAENVKAMVEVTKEYGVYK